jgi:hypothetical protein
MAAMPLETIGGAGRISSRAAEVIRASRGSENTELERAASRLRCSGRGGRPAEKRPGSKDTSGSGSSSKIKGRPRAAEVESTAEDIKFLGKFQGTPGLSRRRRYSLFIRLKGFSAGGLALSIGKDEILQNNGFAFSS